MAHETSTLKPFSLEYSTFFVTFWFSLIFRTFRCNWMRSEFLYFYLCYFSNVMATNIWSIVLTRSSISRHLKFITNRVISIFHNVAFLEQFWLQIGNNMPLKTPGNHGIGDFHKNKRKKVNIFKKKFNFINFEIIQLHLKVLKIKENKKVTENSDNSNAKGFTYVVSCAKKNRYVLIFMTYKLY